jgi:hypothetical protein
MKPELQLLELNCLEEREMAVGMKAKRNKDR